MGKPGHNEKKTNDTSHAAEKCGCGRKLNPGRPLTCSGCGRIPALCGCASLATGEPPSTPRVTLRFVISGEEVTACGPEHAQLKSLMLEALGRSQNLSRPIEDWRARSSTGKELNPNRPLNALGLKDGFRVWLSLAGAGGVDVAVPPDGEARASGATAQSEPSSGGAGKGSRLDVCTCRHRRRSHGLAPGGKCQKPTCKCERFTLLQAAKQPAAPATGPHLLEGGNLTLLGRKWLAEYLAADRREAEELKELMAGGRAPPLGAVNYLRFRTELAGLDGDARSMPPWKVLDGVAQDAWDAASYAVLAAASAEDLAVARSPSDDEAHCACGRELVAGSSGTDMVCPACSLTSEACRCEPVADVKAEARPPGWVTALLGARDVVLLAAGSLGVYAREAGNAQMAELAQKCQATGARLMTMAELISLRSGEHLLPEHGWTALSVGARLWRVSARASFTAGLLKALALELRQKPLERAPRLGTSLERLAERMRLDGGTLSSLAQLAELKPGEPVPPHLAGLSEALGAIVPTAEDLAAVQQLQQGALGPEDSAVPGPGSSEGQALIAAAGELRPKVEALGAWLDGWNAHLGLWEAAVQWRGCRLVLRQPTGDLLLEEIRRFHEAVASGGAS